MFEYQFFFFIYAYSEFRYFEVIFSNFMKTTLETYVPFPYRKYTLCAVIESLTIISAAINYIMSIIINLFIMTRLLPVPQGC